MKAKSILAGMLLAAFMSPKVCAQTFCNPINLPYRYALDGSYREAADPSLINYEGEYYLFASKCGAYFHSTDLLTYLDSYKEQPAYRRICPGCRGHERQVVFYSFCWNNKVLCNG